MSKSALGRKYFLSSFFIPFRLRQFGLSDTATNKTTIVLLQIIEFWKSQAGWQHHRIACIDTTQKRVDSIVKERTAQSSNRHLSNHFIRIGAFLTPRFSQNTQFVVKRIQGGRNSTGQS